MKIGLNQQNNDLGKGGEVARKKSGQKNKQGIPRLVEECDGQKDFN